MAKKLPIKKIRTVEQLSRLRKFSWRLNFSYKKIVSLLITIVLLITISLLWYGLFFGNYFQIKQVRFDEQNIIELQDPEMYRILQDSILGKNYFRILLFGSELSKQQSMYPFIEKVSYIWQGNNTLFVSYAFQEPRVIFTL